MFGMAMATFVVTKLSQWPHAPEIKKIARTGNHSHGKIMRDFTRRHPQQNRLSIKDVAYLVDEVWLGKSALSGLSESLALAHWNPDKPVSLYNLVLMTKDECDLHEKDPRNSKVDHDLTKAINRILEREQRNLVSGLWNDFISQ